MSTPTYADLLQINAAPGDPYPVPVDTKSIATVDGVVYTAMFNGWMQVLNPTTHALDDFIHLTPVSGHTTLTCNAMCARDGALWVIGRSTTPGVGTDIAIYKVLPDGTATKHVTWTDAPALATVQGMGEDPTEPLLYFAVDHLPIAMSPTAAPGIVRYDMTTGAFELVIDADTMKIGNGFSGPATGTGYKIVDVAVFASQVVAFCGYSTTDTLNPDMPPGTGYTAFIAGESWPYPMGTVGKPTGNPDTDDFTFKFWPDFGDYATGYQYEDWTADYDVYYNEPPILPAELSDSDMGGPQRFYCVPNTITIAPEDPLMVSTPNEGAYFTWQVVAI